MAAATTSDSHGDMVGIDSPLIPVAVDRGLDRPCHCLAAAGGGLIGSAAADGVPPGLFEVTPAVTRPGGFPGPASARPGARGRHAGVFPFGSHTTDEVP